MTAIPNEYYRFLNWTDENDEVVSEEPTYTFTAEASRILTANLLNTESVGEHSNTVMMYPNPVNDKLTIEAQESIDQL